MVDAVQQPAQISKPIAITVLKGWQRNLIDHRALPPAFASAKTFRNRLLCASRRRPFVWDHFQISHANLMPTSCGLSRQRQAPGEPFVALALATNGKPSR